tara:strand:+ start:51477 stop:52550 length:1074 start_codon:yes stop_codon:yes gene_type:complete
MKTQFKILLLLLIMPALLFANNETFKYKKEKVIKKEFSVNANAELKVDNSFGNVDIVTWSENRIEIVITITTEGNSEEKTQKKLDEIDVEFSSTASYVSAKTVFHKKGSRNWFGSNDNSSMEINYTIKMPITNSLDLSNDYGSINITKLEGQAKISCDYGQMIIGELMADENYLNFDYTSKSTIEYMRSGKINADYSGFTLEKAERIDLNADYTSSNIGEVINLDYNCDYGKITVDNVTNLEGVGDYISHRIGNVSGSLNINADYGSIKVDRIKSSAKNVVIGADYTSIKMGYESDYNFNFNINLQYASFNGEEELTMRHSSVENSSKKYSGFHGSENSSNTVNINSEYGGVTLIKY